MKKLYFHVLTVFVLILMSCTYKPGGEEFIQIDSKGALPDIQVNLNCVTDTIYVQKSDRIAFSYALNGDKVNWSQFILNGKAIPSTTDQNGSLQLSWYLEGIQTGTFPLEMKIFTHSQTGSIGDKMGAEGFLVSRKWVLVVTDQYHLGSRITKVDFVDGSLKVEWNMYKGVDFKSYKIYKDMAYVQYNLQLVATITSQNQTSYVDNTYHGEKSEYYIVTNDQFYGTSYSITGPLPALTATNNASGDILLTWTKPLFYKNLKGYRIQYQDPLGYMHQVTDISGNEVESYIVPDPFFAYRYKFYLTLLPLSNDFYDDWNLKTFLSTTAEATYGKPSPINFGFSPGGTAPVSYCNYGNQEIRVFNHQSFTTTGTIKYDRNFYMFDVSENYKYLLSYYFTKPCIYLDDLADPSKSRSLDLSATFPQMGSYVSISNVGTGVIVNGQTAVLYDYVNEKKLGEINLLHNGGYSNDISPSGNFFNVKTYWGTEFFQYKNNQIIRIAESVQGADALVKSYYLPGVNEKIVMTNPNRIEVIDCNTWSVEKNWPYPNQISTPFNLDLRSGKLFLNEGNKLILFDVMNGTREELKTKVNPPLGGLDPLFYNNGQIFWGGGKAIY